MHSEPKISSSEKNSFLNIRSIIFFTSIILIILIIALITVLYTTIDHSNTTSSKECLPGLLGNLAITNDGKCDIGVAIERLGFAIGGIIALLVALASFQRARALDDTAKAQEQGNVEERYKNAITQFGNETPSVRLAGAYGLYHLAISNKDRRKNICDVLCVHVRDLTTGEATVGKTIAGKEIIYSKKYKTKPSDEVQSILDLLTNKDNEKNFPFESHWINLANAYLNGANLWGAQLQGANLYKAQFKEADLDQANLENARLQGANFKNAKNLKTVQILKAKDLNLENICLAGLNLSKGNFSNFNLSNAQFQGANLEKTQFHGAHLMCAQFQGANLTEAELQGANLWAVNLQGVNLNKTDLQYANLSSAQLQGTNLWGSQLQGAKLNEAQLQGACLGGAQLQGADLEWVQLQGANLERAQLQGTNLSHAQLQGASLEKTDFRGAFTEGDIIEYDNIDTGLNYFNFIGTNINSAIKHLKARTNKETNIKNAVFSGGVTAEQLMYFKQRIAKMPESLAKIKNYDQSRIYYFKQKMKEVEEILEHNIGKPKDTSIPSKGVITGKYDEEKVKVSIDILISVYTSTKFKDEIKAELSKLNF